MRRLPTQALGTLLACAGLSIAAAPAAPAKSTAVNWRGTLDVSLRVKFERTFESIEKCTPGENGSVTYTLDWEASKGKSKPSTVNFNFINGDGGTTQPVIGAANAALEKGEVGEWKTSTDDCIDSTDVQLPPGVVQPKCNPLSGRLLMTLSTDPQDIGADDLAPLTGGGVFSAQRLGKTSQDVSCIRFFEETDSAPDKTFQFKIGSVVQGAPLSGSLKKYGSTHSALAVSLKKVRTGLVKLSSTKQKQFSHTFKISGPCYAIAASLSGATIGPSFGSPRFEKCVASGAGVIIVRRTSKVNKISF